MTEKNTWAAKFDYGVVYGRTSCRKTPHDPGAEYLFANIFDLVDRVMSPDQVRSDLTPIVGAAKANYAADLYAGFLDGTIGEEDFNYRLSALFMFAKDASFSTTDTGTYCYCQMTGFLSEPLDEESGLYDISSAVAVESAPWSLGAPFSSESECASDCAPMCASALKETYVSTGRRVIFGGCRVTDASTCYGNEIKITWDDATEEDIAANNAGMCTYGGDIRTPLKAATKPGKTFVGWKFRSPSYEQ